MLPDFNADGLLPPGVHDATLVEIGQRLCFTGRRVRIFAGLRLAYEDLSYAGCRGAYLNGSFVTSEPLPGDFDLCFDTAGVELGRLHPVLQMIRPPRTAQHIRYSGDILPNVTEASSGMPMVDYFQNDKIGGGRKGIIFIRLGTS